MLDHQLIQSKHANRYLLTQAILSGKIFGEKTITKKKGEKKDIFPYPS